MKKNDSIKIDSVIRTKRKTISLQIIYDGKLIVKAPFNVSDKDIQRVVIKHKKWIERKRKEIASRPKCVCREFADGEAFLYLGNSYKLHIVDLQEHELKFDNGFYIRRDVLPHARDLFKQWYKKMAYEIISERVAFYAIQRGFKFNKVKITNAGRRWGSCSINGNLNFSWRLIMAPLNVIDYVVIHELAHLIEKNHSKKFWLIVKIIMPDYKNHRNWLLKSSSILKL